MVRLLRQKSELLSCTQPVDGCVSLTYGWPFVRACVRVENTGTCRFKTFEIFNVVMNMPSGYLCSYTNCTSVTVDVPV